MTITMQMEATLTPVLPLSRKEQRNAEQDCSAEADELSFGQIECQPSFDGRSGLWVRETYAILIASIYTESNAVIFEQLPELKIFFARCDSLGQ